MIGLLGNGLNIWHANSRSANKTLHAPAGRRMDGRGWRRALWCKFVAFVRGARSTNFISCSRKTLSCKFISTLSLALSLLYPRQLSICVEMNGHQSRAREKNHTSFLSLSESWAAGAESFGQGKRARMKEQSKVSQAAAFLSRASERAPQQFRLMADWLSERDSPGEFFTQLGKAHCQRPAPFML